MPRQRKTQGAGTGSDKPSNAKAARRTAKKAAPRAASKPRPKAASTGAAGAKRAAKPVAGASRRAATPPGSLEPVTMLRHDEIAERAYLIWMKNGRTPGQEVQHWVEAENQLRQERGVQPQSPR